MLSRIKKLFFFSNQKVDMNFRNVFQPLYIFLSIHGLFPYSIKFNKNKHYTIIPKSIYINSICALSIVLILLFFGILHVKLIYTSIEDSTMIDGVVTKINYVVEIFTLIIFCIIAYICFYLNRYKFVKILNVITMLIESTNGREKDILKRIRHKINFVLGCLPLVFILQITVNFTRHDSLWKMVLVMFNFIFTQMIQFTVVGYFYILLIIVAVLLEYIKESILKITKEKTLPNSFIKVEPRLTMTLGRLERMYVEAFEVKREINHIFQAPLLMSAMQCFHCMVSQSYIIYHGIVVEGNMTTHDFINCSLWLPYQILKIFALAYTGHLLKVEILSLGQALHNVPIEKDDTKLLIEIQHFSSLMHYHGDELSVYGLFPLDATLMSKVMASATMYLIILVQFEKKS